jgi:hypothetical protein
MDSKQATFHAELRQGVMPHKAQGACHWHRVGANPDEFKKIDAVAD